MAHPYIMSVQVIILLLMIHDFAVICQEKTKWNAFIINFRLYLKGQHSLQVE